ncbi:hypothetical protein CMI37_07805 [Candidatus Pacearchaeota archaeon]|nr:hypothetical protein [Candidatus Pacearchaeota archaeon]|tara:strand:- start:10663 stop:11052 length:390 start_codon:yes stop_codon:yes gene_type:complete
MKNKVNGTVYKIIHGPRTLGQKAADGLSRWAGSWTFILGFFLFLGLWMMVNVYAWINTWDPYPFILLNLVLSCLAAIQAPIILMSQNRQSQKDRAKADYDYAINRNSEKGIGEIIRKLNKIERGLMKKR